MDRKKFTETVEKAKEEDCPNVRAVLSHLLSESQSKYNLVVSDHRYSQGYLHALQRLSDEITPKE